MQLKADAMQDLHPPVSGLDLFDCEQRLRCH
jgi:hypothetical protein